MKKKDIQIGETEEPTETATPKPMSMLTAAFKGIEERRLIEGPMNCVKIMWQITNKGYWSDGRGGSTPGNTVD